MATQFTKHLTENDLLNLFQSAYRAGHSTETALSLTRVNNEIDLAMDQGKGVNCHSGDVGFEGCL